MKFRRNFRTGLLSMVLLIFTITPTAAQTTAQPTAQPPASQDGLHLPIDRPLHALRPSWFPTDAAAAERMVRGGLPHSLMGAPFTTMSWTVDVSTDSVDTNPGDSLCADASGDCSLRAAIMEANARAGFDLINLPTGTYTLTLGGINENAAATGDLDITGADGVGVYGDLFGTSVIDAGGLDRVFHVVDSIAIFGNLTITHGVTDALSRGGGINNVGVLSLYHVTIFGNNARSGGGIYSSGELYIFNSLISGNAATTTTSGGIYVATGGLVLSNSTLSGNESVTHSGGLGTDANTSAALSHVTITDNTVTSAVNVSDGGGGMNAWGAVAMAASIVADNSSAIAPDCASNQFAPDGSVVSQGYNLIGNNAGCVMDFALSDLVGTGASPIDSMLGALADNGGKTPTHATLSGSPARDAIPRKSSAYEDQRGVRRPQEGNGDTNRRGDIGAFEFALPFTPLSPLPNDIQNSNTLAFSWTAKPGETIYRIQGKAIGTTFKFNRNVAASETCLGAVCHYSRFFPSLPNHKTLQWRVIANTLPKSTSPWTGFKIQIPGVPTIYEPGQNSSVADTTPTLRWSDITSDRFILKLVNVKSGNVIKKFNLTANSTPSRSDACVDGQCTLTTDAFGVTLGAGKTYSLVVEARLRVGNADQTKFYNYVSKSAKRTFKVIAGSGLLSAPAAPDLRSSGK